MQRTKNSQNNLLKKNKVGGLIFSNTYYKAIVSVVLVWYRVRRVDW